MASPVNDAVLASLREKARAICPNGCKNTRREWMCARCTLMAEFAYLMLVQYGAVNERTEPK